MVVIEREKEIGNVKNLNKALLRKGFRNIRYFKKAESIIDAIKQVDFAPYIEEDKPALYFPPISMHDAPFVIQSNRILVNAENENKANELIRVFISKHLE